MSKESSTLREAKIKEVALKLFVELIAMDMGPEMTMRRCLVKAEKGLGVLDKYTLEEE